MLLLLCEIFFDRWQSIMCSVVGYILASVLSFVLISTSRLNLILPNGYLLSLPWLSSLIVVLLFFDLSVIITRSFNRDSQITDKIETPNKMDIELGNGNGNGNGNQFQANESNDNSNLNRQMPIQSGGNQQPQNLYPCENNQSSELEFETPNQNQYEVGNVRGNVSGNGSGNGLYGTHEQFQFQSQSQSQSQFQPQPNDLPPALKNISSPISQMATMTNDDYYDELNGLSTIEEKSETEDSPIQIKTQEDESDKTEGITLNVAKN